MKKTIFPRLESNSHFQNILFYTQVVIYVGLMVYVILISTNFSNLLLSRVGTDTSGHTLSWMAILFAALYMRLKTPYKEHPIYNATQSFIAFAFAASIVEGIWHVFFSIYNFFIFFNLMITEVIILVCIGITVFAGTYKLFNKKKFWMAVMFMIYYIGLWALFGFPISVDATDWSRPKSTFYYSSFINLIEVCQWIFGMGIFTRAYKGVE